MNFTKIFAAHKSRNIFFAAISFAYAFIIYTLTVEPTTSFWDPAEYIAISHTLQIAHPPGSPFFALIGRLVSMFVPAEHVAWSINMISVTASSLTIMLLYLIVVQLIQEWRGPAEKMKGMDLIGLYGGGLIAALTFTATHTQWFNAGETEMYATSLFLTALVVWLALHWSANHEKPYSERWLVLIAYIMGLSIGIHLLNLLAIFFVAMIIYYKKYTFSIPSFLGMMGVSIVAFLSVYPVTIILIPKLSGQIGSMTYGLIGPATFIVIFIAAICYVLYYTQKKGYRTANIVVLAFTVIIIGYSSYALVLIRSQAGPPIDENAPATVDAFVSYLSRDQYGTSPLLKGHTYDNNLRTIDRQSESLFPRRHSSQPHHLALYANYNSDLDYFLSYQMNHMYMRYFFWNFIGKEADIQDTGWYSGFSETRHSGNPANSGYFYLPFLLGLLGMIYHFRNDPKRALSVLALFILTGLAITFYLNQTPSEPRERDYAYAGSFFAYAIWVGLGVTGIIELIKQRLDKSQTIAYASLGVIFLAVPALMLQQNWTGHDRSDRYVARDYAYNLLNSVEENAILFTNGDNDTFPLWYIQEVEGVRTDVRVVNLSLLNTDWYIKQLRDRQTHESLPLAITLTDEEIDQMTSQLELYTPQEITIPVNKPLLRHVFNSESGNLESYDPLAIPDSILQVVPDNEMFENQIRMAVPYSLPVEELDDEVRWFVQGRAAGPDAQGNQRYYLQTQDKMILEILQNNMWLRPIYFANTVSRDGLLNLDNYFQFEGKTFRIVPKQRETGPFGFIDAEVHADRLSTFEFNNWNDPDVYFDENIRRMLSNYRYGFTQLADKYIELGDPESAAYWLKYGEDNIPFRDIEHDWTIPSLYAYRYMTVGEMERATRLATFISEKLKHDLTWEVKYLDEVEDSLSELEEEMQRARSSANLSRGQRLRTQAERLVNRRESIVEEVSFAVSRLTILQNIYYENDDEDAAESLRLQVNVITDGRLNLPDSSEQSREQIRMFGL